MTLKQLSENTNLRGEYPSLVQLRALDFHMARMPIPLGKIQKLDASILDAKQHPTRDKIIGMLITAVCLSLVAGVILSAYFACISNPWLCFIPVGTVLATWIAAVIIIKNTSALKAFLGPFIPGAGGAAFSMLWTAGALILGSFIPAYQGFHRVKSLEADRKSYMLNVHLDSAPLFIFCTEHKDELNTLVGFLKEQIKDKQESDTITINDVAYPAGHIQSLISTLPECITKYEQLFKQHPELVSKDQVEIAKEHERLFQPARDMPQDSLCVKDSVTAVLVC